jgi:hypothetical protein
MITPQVLMEKLDHYTEQLYQGAIAKIDMFNKSKLTAKVQPLLKTERKGKFENLPVIVDVSVNCFFSGNTLIIPDYKRGDLVWLGFSSYPINLSIRGKHQEITPNKFGLENAVILGGYAEQPFNLPTNLSLDGLTIAHKNGTYINVQDGKVEIKGSMDSTQYVLLGEDTVQKLKDLIDAILNITVMTPVGPSSPVSGMPSNQTALNNIKNSLDELLSDGVKSN